MNCGRVSNQLSAYIDRELTGAEMLHIRSHLGDCDSCRTEYEALCRVKMVLGRLPAPTPQAQFAAGTVRRFHQAGPGFAGVRRVSREGRPIAAIDGLFPGVAARVEGLRRYLTPGAWRLTVGVATAALALALVFTSLVGRRPQHPDALVATSPISVLEGQDPLDSQPIPDRVPINLPQIGQQWRRPSTELSPLRWITVSFEGDGRSGLP